MAGAASNFQTTNIDLIGSKFSENL